MLEICFQIVSNLFHRTVITLGWRIIFEVKNNMVNAKIALSIIVASVLIAAVVGIAFASYASAQSQAPQGTFGGNYPYPQQGYYPYGSGQNSYPFGYGRMGMVMCGR